MKKNLDEKTIVENSSSINDNNKEKIKINEKKLILDNDGSEMEKNKQPKEKQANEESQKSVDDVTDSKELELNQEIENLRNEKLRLLADMENLRKRFERDKIDSIRYGSINLARDILSPGDNLSRALDSIPTDEKRSDTIKNLIDGLKMVQKELTSVLEKHGVKKIEAINKHFDHNFHQAVLEIENEKVDEGLVVQEIQSGFTMYDRLLRPTMVGVSKKPQQNKNKQEK